MWSAAQGPDSPQANGSRPNKHCAARCSAWAKRLAVGVVVVGIAIVALQTIPQSTKKHTNSGETNSLLRETAPPPRAVEGAVRVGNVADPMRCGQLSEVRGGQSYRHIPTWKDTY